MMPIACVSSLPVPRPSWLNPPQPSPATLTLSPVRPSIVYSIWLPSPRDNPRRKPYHAGRTTRNRETWRQRMALRKFIIERDIPGAGSLEREQLRGAAAKSNEVLRQLGPDIQWVDSYVA